MRRLLIFGAAALIGLGLPAASRADGMPPGQVQVKKKVVHRVHHRRVLARVPAVVGLPGPYDLHAVPPHPLDSAYEPAMVSYFRDVSITGYAPGTAAAYQVDDAGHDVAGIYYHRTSWGGAPVPHLPPPAIDNFPFRQYPGPAVLQYDGLIGEYVQLSSRDAALAMQRMQDKPAPLSPRFPR
jgi:hypothetical protein